MRRPAALLLATAVLLPGGVSHAAQPTTWHATQARVAGAQVPGDSGRGVVVAVIDTWVDPEHENYPDRVLAGASCSGGRCTPGQGSSDGCVHGTHVAGTIVSTYYGVAHAARVLPIRILRRNSNGVCTGSSTDAAAAIQWATEHGADVINLSVAGESALLVQASDMTAAIADAAAAGVVVVVAAGNEDRPLNADYGNTALIVAATDKDRRLASYSERGDGIDVAAPGGDQAGTTGDCKAETCVASTFPNDGYAAMAGTSMAAPHVSGLAALLLAQAPNRGRSDVMRVIRDTARPLATAADTAEAGDGLIDMTAALAVRGGTPKPKPRPTATTPAPPVSANRPRTSTAPTPRATTLSPKPAVTAAPKPSPTVSLSPTPTPSESNGEPSGAATNDPVQLSAPPDSTQERTVPVGVATGLLALVGSAVAVVGRRPRTR